MAVCLTCTQTKTLPRCSTLLTIGRINHVSQTIYIFIQNITTGYLARQEATSTATGIVNIDMTDPSRDFFSQNHTYEVWVTFRDTTVEERVPIELGGGTSECFNFEFQAVYSTTNTPAVYATYQLQLDTNVTLVNPIMDFDTNDDEAVNLDSVTPANVERWINRAQNNDAVQTGAAAQPAFTAAGLNGQATFTFTANDHFIIDDFSYSRNYFHFMILIRPNVGAQPIFGHGDTNNQPHQSLEMIVGDELQYTIRDATNNYIITSEGAVISDGAFHVIEAIFEDSHITLWNDGLPLQLTSDAQSGPTNIPEITADLLVGGVDIIGVITGFSGQMRCWKVWDSVITATQRQDELLRMLAKI